MGAPRRPARGRPWRTAASFGVRAGSLGPLRRAKGGEGGGVGVSVARGIEGRPWAAARAGARPGSFVTTTALRSTIEVGQGRSEEEACCSDDGMGGKVSGACKRGTHGRAVLAGMAQ